ncbi:hypothetical protein THIOM_004623 [Candidatus Thiomargarita nelsonii]|uniref:Uncharacterized protein n=1 Tax=Candidatus Thiomargarita nelsonii TaxID=1003181 RepID=A0A176RVI0_9GAMM|nr:hypothetical protein THIOM_004623 [Candidatus Thiomargarita nelsonii]
MKLKLNFQQNMIHGISLILKKFQLILVLKILPKITIIICTGHLKNHETHIKKKCDKYNYQLFFINNCIYYEVKLASPFANLLTEKTD